MSKKSIDKLVRSAETIAREYKHGYMFTEHVFLAMLNSEEFVNILVDYGVDIDDLRHDVKDYLAYATSALREAKNGNKVVEEVLSKTGIKIEIIFFSIL